MEGCSVQYASTQDVSTVSKSILVSASSPLPARLRDINAWRKIAIGKRLDEIPNAVTGKTVASFGPPSNMILNPHGR